MKYVNITNANVFVEEITTFKEIERNNYSLRSDILTDFNYATLTSLDIFQKTVECKLTLLRLCHHKLTSSFKTLILTVQPNLMTLLLRIHSGH